MAQRETQLSLLSEHADKHALPAVKGLVKLAEYFGVLPPILVDILKASMRYAFDDIKNNNSENAEIRAGVSEAVAAHRMLFEGKYNQVTPDVLRNLVQRLTKKGVESRQSEAIRITVAATLGGSEEGIASVDDLVTAEWLENAPDSKKLLLQDLTKDLFGQEAISPIRTPKMFIDTKLLMSKISPCVVVPNRAFETFWQNAATWWGSDGVIDAMFNRTSSYGINKYHQVGKGIVIKPRGNDSENRTIRGLVDIDVEAENVNGVAVRVDKDELFPELHHTLEGQNENTLASVIWPTPLLQRIHNAFVRSRQMMEFDLKQYAEGKPVSSTSTETA